MNTVPPVFSTPQKLFEERRKFEAVKAQLRIGGKLLCWHDYTYMGTSKPKESIFDWRYVYLCTKCGREKLYKHLQVEPIITHTN